MHRSQEESSLSEQTTAENLATDEMVENFKNFGRNNPA